MDAILKARNAEAKRIHPDLHPDIGDLPIKKLMRAYEALVSYWKLHDTPPPSEASNAAARRRAAEEREKAEREEARRQQARRRAALPLIVPPFRKHAIHDLIDAIETFKYGWAALIIPGAAVAVIAAIWLGVALCNALTPEGSDLPNTVPMMAVGLLLALEGYFIAYPLSAIYQLYKIDLARAERRSSHPNDQIPGLIKQALSRQTQGPWAVDDPVSDAQDASHLVTARLKTQLKVPGLAALTCEIRLFVKFKADVDEGSSRYAFWFERKASGPWWHPPLQTTLWVAKNLSVALT